MFFKNAHTNESIQRHKYLQEPGYHPFEKGIPKVFSSKWIWWDDLIDRWVSPKRYNVVRVANDNYFLVKKKLGKNATIFYLDTGNLMNVKDILIKERWKKF